MTIEQGLVAKFSLDRKYRYRLMRRVGLTDDAVTFVMLNPSTADETHDDPTIRRCINFAKAWGFRTLHVTNLSPLRATDPRELLAAGPEPPEIWDRNLDHITAAVGSSDRVVVAWGIHGGAEARDERVLNGLRPLTTVVCLGVTAKGFPKHPLYVASDTPVVPYRHGGKPALI